MFLTAPVYMVHSTIWWPVARNCRLTGKIQYTDGKYTRKDMHVVSGTCQQEDMHVVSGTCQQDRHVVSGTCQQEDRHVVSGTCQQEDMHVVNGTRKHEDMHMVNGTRKHQDMHTVNETCKHKLTRTFVWWVKTRKHVNIHMTSGTRRQMHGDWNHIYNRTNKWRVHNNRVSQEMFHLSFFNRRVSTPQLGTRLPDRVAD